MNVQIIVQVKKKKCFLILHNFDGEKNEKILDEIINISPYIVRNIGPKAYSLYAFITKEKNEGFCAYIRNKIGLYIKIQIKLEK